MPAHGDIQGIFSSESPEDPIFRDIRDMIQRLRDGGQAPFVYIERTKDGLTWRRPIIKVLKSNNRLDVQTEMPWDGNINRWLTLAEVRAVDMANEGVRFFLMMRDSIKSLDVRYGDGYTNSVLVDILKEEPFAQDPGVAENLKHQTALPPSKPSESYNQCRGLIIRHMQEDRTLALRHLGYSAAEANRLIFMAAGFLLDERFSISNRRELGWL